MRQSIRDGLTYLRGQWRTLPDTEATVHAWNEAARGYDDETVAAAFRLVALKHKSTAPPVPAHFEESLGAAYKRLHPAILPVRRDGDDGVYCTRCGTRTLVEAIDQSRPRLVWRLWPLHAPDCPLSVDFPESHLPWPPRREEDAA